MIKENYVYVYVLIKKEDLPIGIGPTDSLLLTMIITKEQPVGLRL